MTFIFIHLDFNITQCQCFLTNKGFLQVIKNTHFRRRKKISEKLILLFIKKNFIMKINMLQIYRIFRIHLKYKFMESISLYAFDFAESVDLIK